MQMDVEFKKEQICTFFVWVGALERGVRGGRSLRGVTPKSGHAFLKIKHPPV
jgi:hypothetical protein